MFDLTGKKALVTGAAGGIGSVVSRTLYERGAFVTLSDMNRDPLEKMVSELGERAWAVEANLSDAESITRLANQAGDAMGGVDILVNNAGLTKDNLFMRMKDEEWEKVLEINLTAAFRLSRAVLRGMMKQRFGRIIGIASIVGVTGNPGQANYSASKAGMIGMTKCLAGEVAARGVTANCVAPGFIRTPMTDVLPDDQKQALSSSIPMNHLGTPEDVAAAVAFLSSEEAGYMTGQTLHVNGGMAMI